MHHISEGEFRRYAAERRLELAQDIRNSGLTIYEIAKGTRMKWDTVLRISQGKPSHGDSQDRVRCYLEQATQKPAL